MKIGNSLEPYAGDISHIALLRRLQVDKNAIAPRPPAATCSTDPASGIHILVNRIALM